MVYRWGVTLKYVVWHVEMDSLNALKVKAGASISLEASESIQPVAMSMSASIIIRNNITV